MTHGKQGSSANLYTSHFVAFSRVAPHLSTESDKVAKDSNYSRQHPPEVHEQGADVSPDGPNGRTVSRKALPARSFLPAFSPLTVDTWLGLRGGTGPRPRRRISGGAGALSRGYVSR